MQKDIDRTEKLKIESYVTLSFGRSAHSLSFRPLHCFWSKRRKALDMKTDGRQVMFSLWHLEHFVYDIK